MSKYISTENLKMFRDPETAETKIKSKSVPQELYPSPNEKEN